MWRTDLTATTVFFLFFVKSAVSVSFPFKLGRRMTAGSGRRKNEDLRPCKYKLLFVVSELFVASDAI